MLPDGKPLGRVRFPTMRVSLEAVIRLLVEEFGVPCNESDEVWRPALESTERAFFEVQHLPLSFAEPPHPRHPERNKARRKK